MENLSEELPFLGPGKGYMVRMSMDRDKVKVVVSLYHRVDDQWKTLGREEINLGMRTSTPLGREEVRWEIISAIRVIYRCHEIELERDKFITELENELNSIDAMAVLVPGNGEADSEPEEVAIVTDRGVEWQKPPAGIVIGQIWESPDGIKRFWNGQRWV